MNEYVAPKIRKSLIDGAQHCMDVGYIFGNVFGTEDLSDSTYVRLKDQVLSIFESFIKDGVPKTGEITLKKVENEKIPFARITSEISLEGDLWPERIEFWDSINDQYGFDWVTGKWTREIEN